MKGMRKMNQNQTNGRRMFPCRCLTELNRLVLALGSDARAVFEQHPRNREQCQCDKSQKTARPVDSQLPVHFKD
jgi:hypothetical protein